MEKFRNDFWDSMRDVYPDMIKSITNLSNKSYLSVTELKSGRTWWSKRALDFFGLKENYTMVGHEKVRATVHPDDKIAYREGFRNRTQGIDLDEPIEYRLQTRPDHYDRFTATCRMVYDTDKVARYLIIHYDNHGIADVVDAVTGLHTEHTMMKDLQEFLDNNVPATIVKIGLNQFSRMNVLYGADYSDAILNAVSQILIAKKTDKGFVYRMSGAKFAIAYKKITDEELKEIYKRIVDALANEIVVNGKRILLKASGGAVHLGPDIKEPNVIRSRMTYALDCSRNERHGELVIFGDDVCGKNAEDLELVRIIHQDAIDRREGFSLYYQPIVNGATGKMRGMEALLRWKKQPYGMVPPGAFIEWLEEDACIYELGNWIVETALRDCKRISRTLPDFFVNVNVCAAQLEHHEFRGKVLELLEKSGLRPNQLCLEITERCRHLDLAFLLREVEFFRSKGIRVALDDFGTGVSSLEVLLDLPVDELKIDMSFTRDIQNRPVNQALVKSIIDFTEKANLETCVEGVENQEVRDHLMKYGATWFQGYFYSKPMPIEELEKMI